MVKLWEKLRKRDYSFPFEESVLFCLYKYFEETLTASEKETKNTFLTKVPIDVYFEIGVISISVEKQTTHFWSQKSHVLIKKLQQIFENYNLLLIFQIKGVVSAEKFDMILNGLKKLWVVVLRLTDNRFSR